MVKPPIFAIGLSLVIVFIVVSGVWAQWPDDPAVNLLLSDRSGEQSITKVVPTSDGGCYVSWWDNTSGNYDFYLQRLDGAGVIQWAPNGLLISNHTQDTWLTDYDLAVDSSDHAIIAFNDLRAGGDWDIYAYRISPAADFVWGPNGLTISDNAGFEADPRIVVTTAGNIVFSWPEENVIHIRKVTPAGADFWDPSTITLTYTYALSIPRLAQAEDDGFFLQYLRAMGSGGYPPKDLVARKYDADGNNIWDSTGVVVSNAGGFGPQMRPEIIPDLAGGAFSYWYDSRSNILHAYAQHILYDATMDWTPNGVVVSTVVGNLQMSPACVYLAATNELVLFFLNTNGDQSFYGVYGQKIDSTGARGWGSGGLALVAMNSQPRMLLNACKMEDDAIVFYLENPRNDFVNLTVRAIRVNSAGGQVWNPSPVVMSSILSDKLNLDACSNGYSQAVAVWRDKRADLDGDVYLQNINPDGTLGPPFVPPGYIEGLVVEHDGVTPAQNVIVSTFDSLDVLVAVDSTSETGSFGVTVSPGIYHELLARNGYQDVTIDSIVVISDSTTHVGAIMGPPLGCEYVRGDINNNGVANGIDVVYGVVYFKGGTPPPVRCDMCPQPSPFYAAGDVNGSCVFNGIDITYYVSVLRGNPAGLLFCPTCPPAQ